MKAEYSERHLLEGLAKNDKTAVETLYRSHFKMIQGLVINNNGTSDDAKDIFQEALIVLYEKTRSGSFELNCLIKTYLYSVARRLWLKKLQQSSRFGGEIVNADQLAPVEDDLEAHQQKEAEFELMHKAIQGLGEPCRGLLEAFYVKKQGMQEIAGQFGYTNAENAKTQKYKCLMRLKKIFFSHYKNGTGDE